MLESASKQERFRGRHFLFSSANFFLFDLRVKDNRVVVIINYPPTQAKFNQ